jgi:hypothetical protein
MYTHAPIWIGQEFRKAARDLACTDVQASAFIWHSNTAVYVFPLNCRGYSGRCPHSRLAGSVAHNFIPSTERAAAGTIFYLQARERIQDRLYYVLDQALVPKQADWMAISVPEVFYPLYYFLRPLRLIYKFGIMPVKDLIKSKLKTILALF